MEKVEKPLVQLAVVVVVVLLLEKVVVVGKELLRVRRQRTFLEKMGKKVVVVGVVPMFHQLFLIL